MTQSEVSACGSILRNSCVPGGVRRLPFFGTKLEDDDILKDKIILTKQARCYEMVILYVIWSLK